MSSARVDAFKPETNGECLREELDLIYERREDAKKRMEGQRVRTKKAYDKKVKKRGFVVGDWVLRQADALKATGKLEANWERPYKVISVLKGGAYELVDKDDVKVPRPWNIGHLKKYFM